MRLQILILGIFLSLAGSVPASALDCSGFLKASFWKGSTKRAEFDASTFHQWKKKYLEALQSGQQSIPAEDSVESKLAFLEASSQWKNRDSRSLLETKKGKRWLARQLRPLSFKKGLTERQIRQVLTRVYLAANASRFKKTWKERLLVNLPKNKLKKRIETALAGRDAVEAAGRLGLIRNESVRERLEKSLGRSRHHRKGLLAVTLNYLLISTQLAPVPIYFPRWDYEVHMKVPEKTLNRYKKKAARLGQDEAFEAVYPELAKRLGWRKAGVGYAQIQPALMRVMVAYLVYSLTMSFAVPQFTNDNAVDSPPPVQETWYEESYYNYWAEQFAQKNGRPPNLEDNINDRKKWITFHKAVQDRKERMIKLCNKDPDCID